MKTPRIVVVGSSNTDMVIKGQRLPGPGETVKGGTFVMAAGGKGANQAVAAARLGAQVTLVAKVGTDVFGDQAIAGYRKDGIATDFILRDPAGHTGVALILVDDQGENLISVASGANAALRPQDVQQAADRIRSADVVVLQLEIPLETVECHGPAGRRGGRTRDPRPRPCARRPLGPRLLEHTSYLKPNETEAERLSGVPVTDETCHGRPPASYSKTAPKTSSSPSAPRGPCGSPPNNPALSPAAASRPSIAPRRATPSAADWLVPWPAGCRWKNRSVTPAVSGPSRSRGSGPSRRCRRRRK